MKSGRHVTFLIWVPFAGFKSTEDRWRYNRFISSGVGTLFCIVFSFRKDE